MEVIEKEHKIQEITLETLARTFFHEFSTYGFNLSDYLRFINILLDFALNNEKKTGQKEKSKK